jgi:ribose 5-phosphate isomerase B
VFSGDSNCTVLREALRLKTIKDKHVLVAADFAGLGLKDAVVRHLQIKRWKVTDVGTKADDSGTPEMYHRIGLRAGAMIAEGEFERAILFCGTGMGIHIAAGKCPHVHSAVVESVPAALRCVTANNCNVMAMGGFYIAPRKGMAMADAFLEHHLGDGYEAWEGFYEYHKLGYDELESFDYEAYKANGFQLTETAVVTLGPEPEGLAY